MAFEPLSGNGTAGAYDGTEPRVGLQTMNKIRNSFNDHEERIVDLEAGTPGDVTGPASALDDRIATFDGGTGKLLQDGGKSIAGVEAAAATYADGVSATALGAAMDYADSLFPVDLAADVSGQLPTANVADDAVTNAKAANMAASTVKGRATGAGTGDPTDLTANQTSTILDAATDPFVRTSALAGAGLGNVSGPAASVDGEIALFDSTTGKLLKRLTGTGFVRAASGIGSVSKLKRTVGMMIGDGTNVISTGVQGFVSCPITGTITNVRLLSSDAAATSGSIVVDVWKDTYANYPPTVADTITASAKPTISSATKSEDSTLTGWTTAVTAGDVFGFKVDSVTSLKRVTVELTVQE